MSTVQIAILVYPGMTALDAVGPYEVLHGLDGVSIRFVWREPGAILTDSGVLVLAATHSLEETRSPDVVIVPGSSGDTAVIMRDREVCAWLREVHGTTRITASVCSGALILAAAGLLQGKRATTHWFGMKALGLLGASCQPDERVVRDGKIWTAAGVSAGIDLGLLLASELAGELAARTAQLWIEYDPRPPFDSGHVSVASEEVIRGARRIARREAMNVRSALSVPGILARQIARAIENLRREHKGS